MSSSSSSRSVPEVNSKRFFHEFPDFTGAMVTQEGAGQAQAISIDVLDALDGLKAATVICTNHRGFSETEHLLIYSLDKLGVHLINT